MEIGKRYRLSESLERKLFNEDLHIRMNNINRAGPNEITVEAGTEVEVLGIDAMNRALLLILSGEYKGRKFPSSPRTQSLFEET